MSELKNLLSTLVQFESITPKDGGCQPFMIDWLSSIGFKCEVMNQPPVSNFFAYIGNKTPLLVFAGHTDVVHPGELKYWSTQPFELCQKGDLLFGRGVADMKGSLACMMLAAKEFVEEHPAFNGGLGFLITSGEEGEDFDLGTPYIMEQLKQVGTQIDYCILGEPSSTTQIGDVIKVGRRGSLTGRLSYHGKQGHVAYPHLAQNPIHTLSTPLKKLVDTIWDKGNEYFPPTSFQVTHIESGGLGSNVIPGDLFMQFNFRYSTEHNDETLIKAVENCFSDHGVDAKIEWQLNGRPFLTNDSSLVKKTIKVIEDETKKQPELSTSGGTSDGRFIVPHGVELIELGPVNKTIHQINECVSYQDLEKLKSMYYELCREILL